MDMSLWLSIIGLFATLVFGLLSIDLFKRKRNPGKFILARQNVIGLFNNIAQNFDEVSIQYKGSSIKDNIIYIEASMINAGDIDIDGANVEKTITLKLENHCKWIAAIMSKASPELSIKTEISKDSSELKFFFGLIRKKEFFQFEALIEMAESDFKANRVFDVMRISHRIANTRSVIKVVELLSKKQILLKKKRMLFLAGLMGLSMLLLGLILYIETFAPKPAPIYHFRRGDQIYAARITYDAKVRLDNVKTRQWTFVSIDEFQNGNYSPFVLNKSLPLEYWKEMLWMILIIVLIFVSIGGEYLELRKSNRFYEILSKYTDN